MAARRSLAAASKRLRSRSGPMWRTRSPACRSINPIVTSPDVTMASNASGETPSFSTWRSIGRRGTRSVADQNDGAAPAPERNKRLRGWREGGHAIVHYAPDIAKNRVIAVGDLAETANLPDDLRLFLPHRRPLG